MTSLNDYVKEAIRAAGLPIDPAMDWSLYLHKMYGPALSPLTKDLDLIEDAIRNMLVEELYLRRILSPGSTYAHFNPNHESFEDGKPLANKVTAYLVAVFKRRRKEVVSYVKRSLGIGSKGSLGLAPAFRLEQPSSDGDVMESGVMGECDQAIVDLEGSDEVSQFLGAFKEFVAETQFEYTARTLVFITKCFENGMDKDEIRIQVIDNPTFSGRFGETLNADGADYMIKQWGKLIRAFARDRRRGCSTLSIARMIRRGTAAEMRATLGKSVLAA